MKSERSLALVSTTNQYFKRFVPFSSPRPIRKKHTDRVFLSSALWVVGSGLSAVGSGLSLPIYSPPLGHVRHWFFRPNRNHSDSLHTSDGALICLQSWATVGLYAGETLCFLLHIEIFQFIDLIQIIRIPCIRSTVHWYACTHEPPSGCMQGKPCVLFYT